MVINAIGFGGDCTTWSVHDSAELEKSGKPTVTTCTDRFEFLARATYEGLDMLRLPSAIVPHPVGGLKPEEVSEKGDRVIKGIITRSLK